MKGTLKVFLIITLLLISMLFTISYADEDIVEDIAVQETVVEEPKTMAPSEIEFENFVLPYAGAKYDTMISIKGNFPGKITKYGFSLNDVLIRNETVASAGDIISFSVYVELNDGYGWPEDIQAFINEVEEDRIIRKDDSGKTICFVWDDIEVGYTDSIVINSQSPDVIKYYKGENIKLFVSASGADSYQWKRYEKTGSGKNTKIVPTVIEGATSSEYVIKDADTSLSSSIYLCVISGKDGEILSSPISFKLLRDSSNSKKVTWGNASDWAISELDKSNALGLVPDIFENGDLTQNITRREFAHVAVKLYERVAGIEALKQTYNPFTDTDDQEVLKALALGITQGTSATTFEPDAEITREQMATMMTRALKKAAVTTEINLNEVERFVDNDDIGEWYVDSVYFMSSYGIIKGLDDGRFAPKMGATREASLLISERSAVEFGD